MPGALSKVKSAAGANATGAFAIGTGLAAAVGTAYGFKKADQIAGRMAGYGDHGWLGSAVKMHMMGMSGAAATLGMYGGHTTPQGDAFTAATAGVAVGAAALGAYSMLDKKQGMGKTKPHLLKKNPRPRGLLDRLDNMGRRVYNGASRSVTGTINVGAGRGAGAAIAGGAVAGLSVANIALRSVDRLAQRMLQEGTADFRPVTKTTPPKRRRVQGSTTSTRVARFSGAPGGSAWGGDSVLALRKTGGRGGVRR